MGLRFGGKADDLKKKSRRKHERGRQCGKTE